MTFAPTNHFTGILRDAATTLTLYTNSSGGGQAVSVWDWAISVALIETPAGTAVRFNGSIQVNGTVVAQVECMCLGASAANISKSSNNGGAQLFLPNGALITLVGNTPFTAPSAWAVTGDITVGISAGSP